MKSHRFQRGYIGPANRRVLGGGSGGASLPITQNLAAWFKYGSGITVTGAGVSQWDDRSGNGRHLKQATDANRPSKEADGSILFDGVDNYLKCDIFTLNQPETVYLLLNPVTWTTVEAFCDGGFNDRMHILQQTTTPNVDMFAGLLVAAQVAFPTGTYSVCSAVFNGASSSLQRNNGTPATGNVGTNNADGFTLGARGGADRFGNIQVKEAILYSSAHDAATRASVISYLMGVGGI